MSPAAIERLMPSTPKRWTLPKLSLISLSCGGKREFGVFPLDHDLERVARGDAHDALHVGKAVDLLAVNRQNEIARLEAGGGGGAARLYGVDPRAGALLADDHENAGENGNRQHEVRDRAGRYNRSAGADLLADEAVLLFILAHGGSGGVIWLASRIVVTEEFHVAAERDRRDLPARSMTVIEADEFWTEAEREREHPDAAPARHQEVAEFMKENDDRQHKQEGNQVAHEPTAERAQARHDV
jgi:hypothetical protein